MNDQEIVRFNSLYELACNKMKGLILIEGYRPKRIGLFKRIRANKAIKYFSQALSIYPEHFQSLFFLGKLYQRLGNYEKALSCFEEALKFEHSNHNLPQEASLVAMHLNLTDKAIAYSAEVLERKPEDFALLGNHAMNLLIAGFDQEAKGMTTKALPLNPADKINQIISTRMNNVLAEKIHRPTYKESLGLV